MSVNSRYDVGVKALNMVIKLATCNGVPVIKLSDVAGKNTGDPATIKAVKQLLGLNHVQPFEASGS